MLVRRNNFLEVIKKLNVSGYKSLDTETTGLRAHKGDRLFSIIIADHAETYYFNFQNYTKAEYENPTVSKWITDKGESLPEIHYNEATDWLPRDWLSHFDELFSNQTITWYLQNAKFDLAMLARDGIRLAGKIHCTEAVARVLDNSHKSYRLADLLKRMNKERGITGPEKIELTEMWVKEFHCFTKAVVPGKKKPVELWHAETVPPQIMIPYGTMDGFATRELGMWQGIQISKFPKRLKVFNMEHRLTKALFDMEEAGMPLNHEYTETRLIAETKIATEQEAYYKSLTGKILVDSALEIMPVLTELGYSVPKTEKGEDSVAKDVLQGIDHPVAKCILDFRSARKKAGTYYSNFLYFKDDHDVIHANFRQGGTATGRLSCMDPNLQNVSKPDEDGTPEENEESKEVRRCFIPPKDHCLLSIDYDQMEYRLMLDEAEEMGLIKKILDGLDIHEATAILMTEKSGRKVTRKQAKTINFMLLYGGGVAKLALALGITFEEAKELKAIYFDALPKVERFIYKTQAITKIQGYVMNWAGRASYIDRNFAYKSPNYKIQGGCADINKFAICALHQFQVEHKTKSKLISTVHDENIFALHKDELHLSTVYKNLMENAYKPKHLPLTCGVSHSWKSWGDMEEGAPT